MSNYLYRLAHFAFRRRRLVLAAWLVAAIAAIAIATLSGGKTNDNFTIPGTEAQNAAAVLTGQAAGVQRRPEHDRLRHHGRHRQGHRSGRQGGDRDGDEPSSGRFRRSPRSRIPSRASWCRRAARSRSGRCSGRRRRPT